MKKLFLTILSLAMAISSYAVCHAEDEIKLVINNETIQSDVPPAIINDRTMVPIRVISETLNCDVCWDGETQGVTVYRNNHFYQMWINKATAFDLDGGLAVSDTYTMDVSPMVVNDRTLVPLRAVAELLGADVNWNGETKTVTVDLELGEKEENQGIAEMFLPIGQSLFLNYDLYNSYVNDTLKKEFVNIELNDGGIIELELYPELAPLTCENFIAHANAKTFDGTIFHRVIKDFMIQGGGFYTDDTYAETDPIMGEFIANSVLNLIPHDRGVISMARTDMPDSATTQFFIMHADTPYLNGNYAAFGKVISGIEYVDQIAEVETDEADKPLENVVIKSITVK